jgi:DNA-directed RNA polymerase II subunit RPB2
VDLGECEYDQGGYFIIKGSEKVVVGQERMANNFVFVFKKKTEKNPWCAEVRSVSEEIPNPRKFVIQMIYDLKNKEYLLKVEIEKVVRGKIPIFVLLRALDINDDKSLLECIFADLSTQNIREMMEFLKPSLHEAQ